MATSLPSGTDSKQSCAIEAATVGVADGDATIWLAYAALTMAHGSVRLTIAEVMVVFRVIASAIVWRQAATVNNLHFILFG